MAGFLWPISNTLYKAVSVCLLLINTALSISFQKTLCCRPMNSNVPSVQPVPETSPISAGRKLQSATQNRSIRLQFTAFCQKKKKEKEICLPFLDTTLFLTWLKWDGAEDLPEGCLTHLVRCLIRVTAHSLTKRQKMKYIMKSKEIDTESKR